MLLLRLYNVEFFLTSKKKKMPIDQKTAEIPTPEIEKKITVFWLPLDNAYQSQANFGLIRESLKSNATTLKLGVLQISLQFRPVLSQNPPYNT